MDYINFFLLINIQTIVILLGVGTKEQPIFSNSLAIFTKRGAFLSSMDHQTLV